MFYYNSSIYYAALHGTHHVFQKSMNTALPLYLSVIVGNICCRYRKFGSSDISSDATVMQGIEP